MSSSMPSSRGSPTNRLAADGGEAGAVEGARILVVDDDVRNIFAMTALLERGRADVTVVESGAEALEVLERSPTSTSS